MSLSTFNSPAGRPRPSPFALPHPWQAPDWALPGLRLETDAHYGLQAGPAAESEALGRGIVCPLPDLAVLHFEGPDAVEFLQGQLTNDLVALPEGQAAWFGYCTAKGRLLATCPGWKDGENVWLTVPGDLAETLRKRFAMFVLRSRVRVSQASVALLGLVASDLGLACEAFGTGAPSPMQVLTAGEASIRVLGLPAAGGVSRALVVLPSADLAGAWARVSAVVAPRSSVFWRSTEVRSGIPRIVAATSESFVPQSVNLDLFGGVSFTKGCYPGQEIVARAHWRGTLKRRLYLAHSAGEAPAPGSDVTVPGGREPCGLVALAAPDPSGGSLLLFEGHIEAVGTATELYCGEARLSLLPLPYATPA